MKILAVTSEIYPLIKTGGLADVAGALPAALKGEGLHVTTLVPGYPAVMAALKDAKPLREFANLFGGKATVVSGQAHGLDLLALDAPHLFARLGNPYLGPDGKDWPDNGARFAALSQVASVLARDHGFDRVHMHDWQAGLTAAYLKYFGGPPSIITIHNLAFQGHFPASLFSSLGLPQAAFGMEGVEYYGGVGFLKAGISLANAITTVSPSYAREIQTTDDGMGLDGLLRHRAKDLHGILNGIDTDAWNPAHDAALAQFYDAKAIEKRSANKLALEKRFELSPAQGPLFCIISRLTSQKGMDLVLNSVDLLVAAGANLAVLGSGETALENGFKSAAARHKGRIGVSTAYDEKLAHAIQGGADCILIPSRFEPCGLTQLYGLRYGCIPLVSHVGGLADTLIDANEAAVAAGVATGIVMSDVSQFSYDAALSRAIALHRDKTAWRAMQVAGMKSEVSWKRSATLYANLFHSLKKTS